MYSTRSYANLYLAQGRVRTLLHHPFTAFVVPSAVYDLQPRKQTSYITKSSILSVQAAMQY